jgi:hypothetical protein
MTSEGCAAHPVGYNSPLQTKMAIWRIFLNLYLLVGVWEPTADYSGCLTRQNDHYSLQRAATPDQITQQNMPRAGGP